jgi:hypothetical protein
VCRVTIIGAKTTAHVSSLCLCEGEGRASRKIYLNVNWNVILRSSSIFLNTLVRQVFLPPGPCGSRIADMFLDYTSHYSLLCVYITVQLQMRHQETGGHPECRGMERLPCVVRPGGEDQFVFIETKMNRFDTSIYIPTSFPSKYRSEISCALFSVFKETTAFVFSQEANVCWLHVSQFVRRRGDSQVLPEGSKLMVRKVGTNTTVS